MAWSGTGTFNRIVTTVSPAVGGTTIDVADQNNYTADVTAGIDACLAKNGENAATGDIDLGSNKLTNVSDGLLVTDGVNVGQVQDGSFVYEGSTGGSANAIELTLSPALTAYAAGQVFRFKAAYTNAAGAVTVDIDGVGAVILLSDQGTNHQAAEIFVGAIYTIVYDGIGVFRLQNPTRSPHSVYVSNTNHNSNVSDTVVDFASVALPIQWTTIGPTGSGIAWTALDNVPAGADWIEIKLIGVLTLNPTTILTGNVYARSGAGSQSVAANQTIWSANVSDGTSDSKQITSMTNAKIPIDSSREFDVYWTTTTGATETFNAYLTGYGWN